jgi:hypothetical protein
MWRGKIDGCKERKDDRKKRVSKRLSKGRKPGARVGGRNYLPGERMWPSMSNSLAMFRNMQLPGVYADAFHRQTYLKLLYQKPYSYSGTNFF